MNLYTEELVRLRQAELRTEAEANPVLRSICRRPPAPSAGPAVTRRRRPAPSGRWSVSWGHPAGPTTPRPVSGNPQSGGDDRSMTDSDLISPLRRVVVAVAASIVTGATAGAALAHKPLVVRADEQPRIRRVR